mgnify:FL=1
MIEDKDLVLIVGGASVLSAPLINALSRGLSLALELGRTLGTIIRRKVKNTYC